MKRSMWIGMNALAAWLFWSQLVGFAADRPKQPNVVIIVADDLGYGDLGCYGSRTIRTPHLDRMAAEGTRFTDFYVAQSVCSASRAAILTGCYPNRIGILGALNHQAKHGINVEETTLAEVVKQRSYATGIFGKWHLGHLPQFLPTRHGFDEFFGLPYSNDMGPKPGATSNPPVPLISGEKILPLSDMNRMTSEQTDRALAFIRANSQRPFFLYVPFTMPHVPLGASERFRGKSAAGLIGDVIEEIDHSVGQILTTLAQLGLDEKTVVLFTSDNGPWLSYGNHAGSAGSLREGKGTSWEGGIRVPCLVRWPGQVPAGRVCRTPWMTIDILPTIAQITDCKLPKLPIDGRSAWPLWHGDSSAGSPQAAYFFYWDRGLQAVRAGQWKLHFPHGYATLSGPAGADGQPGKYVTSKTPLALYDLVTDPGEQRDIAAAHPDVVDRLSKLADEIRNDLGDSLINRAGNGIRPSGR